MLDFTSALYLGLRHPAASLRPWTALTTGLPAALMPPGGSTSAAAELAALQGCERATLASSTLHLFWDLFGLLARDKVRIYMDTDSYPIAGWGVERAAARGVPVRRFPHRDASAVAAMIACDDGARGEPVIVTDGFCPSCGKPAPLAHYLECVERRGGYVVVDDTQALGVLGSHPSAAAPYGHGGGGSLRFQGIGSPRVIACSSLAKAFGAPLAALAGSADVVRRFEAHSETRVHCSPPSAPAIHAAERALEVNRTHGARWRGHLLALVRRLRNRLEAAGIATAGGIFPVLTITPRLGLDLVALQNRLLGSGVRGVLTRGCGHVGSGIAFIVTALHDLADIDQAAAAISRAMATGGKRLATQEFAP